MRVKMKIEISGIAPSGGRWPAVGGEIDVPDHTGRKLVGNGQAVEVEAPKPVKKQTATAKKPSSEKR